MNYLAHFFLAGNSQGLIIGNYIADSVKGAAYKNYPFEIANGIMLHRQLDTFIDTHSISQQTKEILKPHFKRYSGIVLDFLYDHLLAKNWNSYSPVPIQAFSDSIISILKNCDELPLEQTQFLRYMINYNIPAAYASEDVIKTALYHYSKRINCPFDLSEALLVYNSNKRNIDVHFNSFFKEAVKFSQDYIKNLELNKP